jgi:F-type H+-transporting ATPase subunit epsilon
MKLIIVTPTEKFFEGEVIAVNAPGDDGHFGVLENHAPFLTTLKNGEVKAIISDKEEKIFKITGGLADINNNIVKILAEAVEVQ